MNSGVLWALCFAIAMAIVPEGRGETVTVEVAPGEVRKNGLPWDTGLGAFLGNKNDILPDIRICIQDPDTERFRCARECKNASQCNARFSLPSNNNKKMNILVYDDDVTNKDEFILSAPLDRWIKCAPCTDGQGKAQSKYWVSGWSKKDCGVYSTGTRAPDVPQPLINIMNKLLASNRSGMDRRFREFYSRGGEIKTCESITYPAVFAPGTDQIRFSAKTLKTESEDVLLRIMLEEIAHATTKLSLSNPARKSLNDWSFEYQQKLLRFEADGWITALLARKAFLAAGTARPPIFALNRPGKSTERKVEQIVDALSRGRISRAEAVRRMVPFVEREQTRYRGRSGTQTISYADHYGQQGVKVWNCAKAGKAKIHKATGIWDCN